MKQAYCIALICGVVPLVVGVTVFLLWLVTRWDWLVLAGIFTIYGGVIVFLIGAVALARFCWLGVRSSELTRRRLWVLTLASAALLLSNFVVAGGIMASVVTIETRYVVEVHNDSHRPLRSVRVVGGGCEADFGSIPAGGVARRTFWIRRDGKLEFRAVSGSMTYSETIDGYVTNSMGGDTTVTINPDGTISVSDETE